MIPRSALGEPPKRITRLPNSVLNAFDAVNIINFTVTFDPRKYTLSDTWSVAIERFETKMNMKKQYYKKYFYVIEKHESGRAHLHGCIYPSQDRCRFQAYENLVGVLNKFIGNTSFQWNDVDFISKSGEYKTYTDYCLKESPKFKYIISGELGVWIDPLYKRVRESI